MRTKISPAVLIGAAVAMLCAATMAQADAVCVKDYRDVTPAEKARMTAILQIAKASLPPAPAGWQIGGYEEISVIDSLCRDYETKPWSYSFSRTYNRVDNLEARDKIMRDAALQAKAAQEQKQPRMDAVMKKMEALTARQVALFQKSDFAGAEKLNAEMARLQAQYQAIADEGDSQAKIAAAGKAYSRDTTMSITINFNSMSIHQRDGATNIALPPGAFVAQRWVDPGDAEKNDEGHGIVLFGTWRTGPPKQWTAPARAGAVPSAAHVISVEFSGDPSRIEPMLQAVNYQTLRTAFTK